MIGQRLALVALLGALTLEGCGGKAVTPAPPAEAQDAATDVPSDADQHASDATSDASPLDAAAEVQVDASPDGVDASQDVAEEPDVAAEAGANSGADADAGWDHTCWCKNWTDERYPQDFFGGGSCVDGFITCPSIAVCCAITCVSPLVCVNTVDGWNNTMPPPAPQTPANDCERTSAQLPDACCPKTAHPTGCSRAGTTIRRRISSRCAPIPATRPRRSGALGGTSDRLPSGVLLASVRTRQATRLARIVT